MQPQIVIVGAGLAGVTAARTLMDYGIRDLVIIEKSRSVGGRLATRRMGKGRVDHGAQFFTCRSPLFTKYVTEWEQSGWVTKWFGGEHPRYMSPLGMNQLVKHLSEDLPVKLNTRVLTIESIENGFQIHSDSEEPIDATGLILTTPVPQVVELTESLQVSEVSQHLLSSFMYNPCFVLIIRTSQASKLPSSGILKTNLPNGVSHIVDHSKKGMSNEVTLSVYSTGDWAKAHYNDDEDTVKQVLLQSMMPYINEESIEEIQLKRWRYAEAVTTSPTSFLDLKQHAPLLVAGDAFVGEEPDAAWARVESAFCSGVEAALAMIKQLEI